MGIDSCSNLCATAKVISIPNVRLLSSIVFILWTFEKFNLFDCDLICDYPVTAFCDVTNSIARNFKS